MGLVLRFAPAKQTLRAILDRPIPAEMPLADAGRFISLLFEHSRKREAARRDQGSSPQPYDAPLQPRAPVVAPGQQCVPRRGTDPRRLLR